MVALFHFPWKSWGVSFNYISATNQCQFLSGCITVIVENPLTETWMNHVHKDDEPSQSSLPNRPLRVVVTLNHLTRCVTSSQHRRHRSCCAKARHIKGEDVCWQCIVLTFNKLSLGTWNLLSQTSTTQRLIKRHWIANVIFQDSLTPAHKCQANQLAYSWQLSAAVADSSAESSENSSWAIPLPYLNDHQSNSWYLMTATLQRLNTQRGVFFLIS